MAVVDTMYLLYDIIRNFLSPKNRSRKSISNGVSDRVTVNALMLIIEDDSRMIP